MFESMYAAKGVGLAAPQIGIGKRIAVIDISNGEDPDEKLVLINPEIIGTRRNADERRRLPQHSRVSRAGHAGRKRVTVRAQNAKGEWFEMTGEDLLARAFLHETDHLNGTPIHHPRQPPEARPDQPQDPQAAKSRRVGLGAGNASGLHGHAGFRGSDAGADREAGHEVRRRSYTQPDRPAGRGQQLAPSPVKEAALRLGLRSTSRERVRRPEVVEQLAAWRRTHGRGRLWPDHPAIDHRPPAAGHHQRARVAAAEVPRAPRRFNGPSRTARRAPA